MWPLVLLAAVGGYYYSQKQKALTPSPAPPPTPAPGTLPPGVYNPPGQSVVVQGPNGPTLVVPPVIPNIVPGPNGPTVVPPIVAPVVVPPAPTVVPPPGVIIPPGTPGAAPLPNAPNLGSVQTLPAPYTATWSAIGTTPPAAGTAVNVTINGTPVPVTFPATLGFTPDASGNAPINMAGTASPFLNAVPGFSLPTMFWATQATS